MLYRICNDAGSPYYRRVVKSSACRRCKAIKMLPAPKPKPKRDIPVSDTSPPKTPGLLRRAMSYAEAVIEWTAAGRPERSNEEVERIFHQFCKPCRWFSRRRQICYGCGCRVADSGFAIFNKIKMATQHCPRKRW